MSHSLISPCFFHFFFFFNDTATTEIYTLSLHDALPICKPASRHWGGTLPSWRHNWACRSEEHTSELQSRFDLVCRLLLEKKKSEKRAGTARATRRNSAIRRFAFDAPRPSDTSAPRSAVRSACSSFFF